MKKTPKKIITRRRKRNVDTISIPIHRVKSKNALPVDEEITETEETQPAEPAVAEPEMAAKAPPREQKMKSVEGVKKDSAHAGAGNKPAPNKAGKKKKLSRGAKVLIGVGIGLFVLATLGIVLRIVLGGGGTFSGEKIDFTLSGPETVMSGGEVDYVISFTNKEAVAFENVNVDVVYPEGLTILSSDPKAANFNETKWELKKVASAEKKEIKLHGRLVGIEGDEKKLTAKVLYKPENVGSSFAEEKEIKTKLTPLKTDFEVTVPKAITSGSEFNIGLNIKNSTGVNLNNLRVKLTYPSNYEYKASDPRPDYGFDTFDLKSIEKDSKEIIKIRGVLTGKANEKNKLKAVLGFVDDKNQFFPQIEEEVDLKISAVLAEIETKVFGSTESAMSPGEFMDFKVHYKNTGTEAFQEVTVETEIENKYINQSTFAVDRGKFENGKVIWNKDTVGDLNRVGPGNEGDLSFKVKIADNIAVAKQEDKNFTIKARSFFKAKGTEANPNQPIQVESKNAVVKINTQVKVGAEGHYYDFEGRKVGSGPLPPAVGKKTVYRVYLLLGNRSNEVNEGKVEIIIPAGVSLTGSKATKVGTISLEKDRVIWNIGKIPAGTGQFTENLEASFEVSLIPDMSQVGKTPGLTQESFFTGVDTFTEQKIRSVIPGVSTDLKEDSYATGKGVVVEKEAEFPNGAENQIVNPTDSGQETLEEPVR